MTKKATFTGKFGINTFDDAGNYTGVVKTVYKTNKTDKAGNTIWYINLTDESRPSYQHGARWVEKDESVNPLARFVVNLMTSLKVNFTEEEITACDFEGLMNLITSKNLLNRKVHYTIEVVEGETASFTKVCFD